MLLEKISVFILSLLFNSICLSQETCRPWVEWKRVDWPHLVPEGPLLSIVPGSEIIEGGYQKQDQSGEDWWYDIATVPAHSGGGYMACGYSTWRDVQTLEKTNLDGCIDYAGNSDPDCNRPLLQGEVLSPKLITLARYNTSGTMLWCYAYANAAEGAISIAATNDGGFVFTGWGMVTRRIDGEPILYNPDGTHGYDLPQLSANACHSLTEKMLVGKTDVDGNLLWLYQYGFYDPGGIYTTEEILSARSSGMAIAETANGNYRVAGRCEDLDNRGFDTEGNPVPFSKFFVVDLAPDGQLINKTLIGNEDYFCDATAIDCRNNDCLITGFQKKNVVTPFSAQAADAVLFKIDGELNVTPFGNDDWMEGTTSAIIQPGMNEKNAIGWDVAYLADGTAAWTYFDDCEGCIGGSYEPGSNAPLAKILHCTDDGTTLKEIDLATVNRYEFERAEAFDIKIGIVATADGGFACVTSFQVQEPSHDAGPYPALLDDLSIQVGDSMCHEASLTRANTDAYVVKFDAQGNFLWDISFDADDKAPAAYPGDWKEQECVYRITEAADGGLVLVGNTSHNKDDYYIAKVSTACAPGSFVMDIYPNPASSLLRINYQLPDYSSGTVYLVLSDLSGKKIDHAALEEQTGKVQLDARNYPNGVYVISLQEESRILCSQKLIILH